MSELQAIDSTTWRFRWHGRIDTRSFFDWKTHDVASWSSQYLSITTASMPMAFVPNADTAFLATLVVGIPQHTSVVCEVAWRIPKSASEWCGLLEWRTRVPHQVATSSHYGNNPGPEGKVHLVTVRTERGTYKRQIKLVPLVQQNWLTLVVAVFHVIVKLLVLVGGTCLCVW